VSERDLDAEFERIIAGWDEEAPDPQPRTDSGTHAPSSDVAATADENEPTHEATGQSVAAEPAHEESASPPLGAEAGSPGSPGSPGPGTPQPGSPTSPPSPSGGVLELPIAPTTSHAWRASEPQRDDADDLLDAVGGDDDHFVPPTEIDLPSAETDPMFWAIVMGLAGGPLLLLYVLLFDRDGSGWWVVTGLTMTVIGFVLLVLRGGTERDPFDDGTRV